MYLVFTGIQGCGKGTQARILVEKYGFNLIEMGTELRKIVNENSEFGDKIKKIINSGKLVPPEMIAEIIKKVFLENKGKNVIFDGFIRNMGNKEAFEEVCDNYKVVFFELSVEKAKQRLLGRMYDSETGETFTAGNEINPKNGNKLVKRDDDKDEKAILKRLSEYEEKTLPIVKKQMEENKVISINADQSIEKVANDLEKELGL